MSKPSEVYETAEEAVLKKVPGAVIESFDSMLNLIYLVLTKLNNDQSAYILVNKEQGLTSVYADVAHMAYDYVKRQVFTLDNIAVIDGGSASFEPNLPYLKGESEEATKERKKQAFVHLQTKLEKKHPDLLDLVHFFPGLWSSLAIAIGIDVTKAIVSELKEAKKGPDWWKERGLLEYWNGEKSITMETPAVESLGDVQTAGITTTPESND